MFKKLFYMLGIVKGDNLDVQIKKIVHNRENFVKLPKDIGQWDESYKEMIRELSKR